MCLYCYYIDCIVGLNVSVLMYDLKSHEILYILQKLEV